LDPFVSTLPAEPPSIPAFPGAEGFGAVAVGGRGERVMEVTNLNDRGPGSFREAVTARGPRIVVFRTGGIIELQSRIDIASPFLTVAGQTAPGGGITLKGSATGGGQMLRIRTHDVVLRHLRIRSGAYGRPGQGQINVCLDPLPARGEEYGDIYNVVLDHLSVSWSLDENIAIFRNMPEDDPSARDTWPRIYDVTVQRCLIAEGLYPHSTGLQVGGERIARDGRQLYNGGMGVSNLSIHHNLFANTSHRNPGLGAKDARMINNVMYNWSSKCSETHDAMRVDWVGNYFKPGPLSAPERLIVHNAFFKGFPQYRFEPPSIHLAGNVNAAMPGQSNHDMYSVHYEGGPLPATYLRTEPMDAALIPVIVQTAEAAYESVLGDIGANVRLDQRGRPHAATDAVDARILRDVRERTGEGVRRDGNRVHITHPDDVGGYPEIETGTPYEDADHDGMADVWERMHGLDPIDASDGLADLDGDGYTNVEEFLNATGPLG
jgi:hypothetical protein